MNGWRRSCEFVLLCMSEAAVARRQLGNSSEIPLEAA